MGFNLLKAVGGAVKGFVTGGPTGAIAGGVRAGFGAPSRRDSTITQRVKLGPYERSTVRDYFSPSLPISNYPVDGGGGGFNGGGGGGAAAGCPTGFRLNKSTYVTRGGGTSKWPAGLQLHPAKTVCVKRRKINAGNGRAATHAVRRLVSFYRLSNRVAKQLRKAASRAHIRGARRGQRALPRGGVEVVNVE